MFVQESHLSTKDEENAREQIHCMMSISEGLTSFFQLALMSVSGCFLLSSSSVDDLSKDRERDHIRCQR